MVPSSIRALSGVTPNGLPGARRLVRAGLAQAFGPPPFDAEQDAGDPGLTGPDSASWRVIGEPASIVGGVRALLVQLLHPLAMAGVADHSRFREDPLRRLRGTSTYVTATTFGSTAQALAVTRRVRRRHRFVVGRAPDGRRYRADDPELLSWVSIALTSSFLATDRAYASRPVDSATADAFVAEQSRAAGLLDPRVDLDTLAADGRALESLRTGTLPLPLLDSGLLPRDVAGLEARLAQFRPALELTQQGREAVRFLCWPGVPALVRAGYFPVLAGAVATLDRDERRLLGVAIPQLLRWPVVAQTQSLLGVFRLTAGRSPAQEAATRRARVASEAA